MFHYSCNVREKKINKSCKTALFYRNLHGAHNIAKSLTTPLWEKKMRNALTHYHTMPHFDALKMYSCGKHCTGEIA